MFSKACEYGIRATVFIAMHSQGNKRSSLNDIAQGINSPEPYTAKILQQLMRNKIIKSITGPHGGFDIDVKTMNDVKLSQIVFALDGDSVYKGCGLGLPECSEKEACPVHDKFKIIRNELRFMLEDTSVYELALGLKEGLTFLKR